MTARMSLSMGVRDWYLALWLAVVGIGALALPQGLGLSAAGFGGPVVLASCALGIVVMALLERRDIAAREAVLSEFGALGATVVPLMAFWGEAAVSEWSITLMLLVLYGFSASLAIRFWACLFVGTPSDIADSLTSGATLRALVVVLLAALIASAVFRNALASVVLVALGCLVAVCIAAICWLPQIQSVPSPRSQSRIGMISRFQPLPVAAGMVITWIAYGYIFQLVIMGGGSKWLLLVAAIGLMGAEVLVGSMVIPKSIAKNSFVLTRLMLPFLICVVFVAPSASGIWSWVLCLLVAFAFGVSFKVILQSHSEILQHTNACVFGMTANVVSKCVGGAALGAAVGVASVLVLGSLDCAALLIGILLAVNSSFLLADRNSLPIWRKGQSKTEAVEESLRDMEMRYGLSARETEVLRLLSEGMNAATIAEELCLSVHTVKTHMKRIYTKMDVHTQQELMGRVRGLANDLARVDS